MPHSAPAAELRDVGKRFPGVVACDGISLAIHAGEVHALLGENGAGKSTLVSLLAGTQRPDSGGVYVDGVALTGNTPALALARGIGVVAQHSVLVPTLTVAENLLLGGPWWRRPARGAVAAKFRDTCAGFGIAIDPAALAGDLSPGAQLQVETVRALWRGGRVLVLDEPTAPLGPAASAHLLATLRGLRQSGLAIVLITHRLDEALDAADRVTVLRRGRVTGRLSPEEVRTVARNVLGERIREMMFGGARLPSPAESAADGPVRASGTALHVEALSVGDALTDIGFSVASGETLGIAGIDGNGQGTLAEALAGLVRPSAGAIILDGGALTGLDAAARHRRGVRHISDDRIGEGTVGALPVALNLLLKQIGAPPFWWRGVQRDGVITAYAARQIAQFDIRAPGPWTRLAALSGGNIQKVMLARELDGAARLIVYHKPTIGLDARSAAAVHARIRRAAADGAVSVVISADLDEIMAVSDRIAVLSRGRIAGTVANGPQARSHIAALMTQ